MISTTKVIYVGKNRGVENRSWRRINTKLTAVFGSFASSDPNWPAKSIPVHDIIDFDFLTVFKVNTDFLVDFSGDRITKLP